MAQNPIAVTIGRGPTNAQSQANLDAEGNLITTSGGAKSSLNLTAAAVIKATPGRLAKLVVLAGGTASNGNFVLNDCATTGAAAAANQVAIIPSGTTAGTVVNLDFPCLVGIVLSAVPSAGSPIAAVSYD